MLTALSGLFLSACSTVEADKVGDSTGGDSGDSAVEFTCPYEAAPASNECAECIDEKCADLVDLCARDEVCACMVDCLATEGMPGIDACLGALGLDSAPAGFPGVEECVGYSCPDGDECSTPRDWTPPEADLECDGTGSDAVPGGTEADCDFDPTLDFDPAGDVLQLVDLDGRLCARIERRSDGTGTLENTEWTLVDLWVGEIGEVAHVNVDTGACWYSSHHNFNDWVHAWTGTRHYDIALKEDGHGGSRRYYLYAFEGPELEPDTCPASAEGEACIEGPVALYGYEP